MYLRHFQLVEKPYNYITSNPRFFYQAPQYSQVRLKINYFVQDRGAHIYLTGPVGVGKTSLLKITAETLTQDEHNLIRIIIAPKLHSANAFMRRICEEYGVKTERSYDGSLQNFVAFLKAQLKQGVFPVLLVDEAENLNRECLKLVHYLLAYTTNETVLIMVILSGQEELAAKINKMPELSSRMFPAALSALSREETEKMMRHRWRIASEHEDNAFPFSAEALDAVFRKSNGVPRTVCKLADLALLSAFSQQRTTVELADAEEAIRQAEQAVKPRKGDHA
jgi:general secretion pathway protein A